MISTIGILLAAASAILGWISFASSKEDLKAFRETMENYWFKVESIGIYEQAGDAIRNYKKFLIKSKKYFLFGFLVSSFVVAAYASYLYQGKSENAIGGTLAGEYNSILYSELNRISDSSRVSRNGNKYMEITGVNCKSLRRNDDWAIVFIKNYTSNIYHNLGYRLYKKDFDFELCLYLYILFSTFISFAIYGLSLFMSLHLTLYFISKISTSNKSLLFIVAADIVTAILIPFILSFLVATLLMLAFSNRFLDMAALSDGLVNVSEAEFALAATASGLYAIFRPIVGVADYLKLGNEDIPWSDLWSYVFAWSHFYFSSLIESARKVLDGKFGQIGIMQSANNWALIFDLTFSFSYIIYSIAIIAISRSRFFKSLISNTIQKLAEQNGGAYAIIASLVGIIIAMLPKLS